MQYTNLKDKKGTKIFESDIVKISGTKPKQHGIIKYKLSGFIVEGKNITLNYLWKGSDLKVIGNIYEKPLDF